MTVRRRDYLKQRIGEDCAGDGYSAQVIAFEIDDHGVLGALLLRLDESASVAPVAGTLSARRRALDGLNARMTRTVRVGFYAQETLG